MRGARDQIEEFFVRWADFVANRPWKIVATMFAVAVVLATRVPFLAIETSTEDYLFEDDPAKVSFDAFREQFGRDDPVLLMIEPPEVFTLDFLRYVETLHRDLENSVSHLADLTSLYNVRSVLGKGDELLVDDLLEKMPTNEEELAILEKRVRETESYQDTVISSDGRVALFQIEADAYSSSDVPEDDLGGFDSPGQREEVSSRVVLTGREVAEFSEDVIAVLERNQRPDFEIHLAGEPLVTFALTRAMADDLPRMFGWALALIGVLIIGLFGRLMPVALAFAVVVLSLLSTLGISELIGIPVSLPTQILPVFILAVGVGYSVHLMTLFYREMALEADRRRALERSLRHVGLPILMTAVTTAAGLISFLAAEMQQVVDLGILSSAGVVVTLIYSLTLLPALLMLIPSRLSARSSFAGLDGENLFLSACARVSVLHPRKVVAGALLLALLPISRLGDFDVTADAIDYFPEDHWLHRAVDFVDERAGGMMSLEVVVDTGRENGLHEPEVLAGIEDLRTLIRQLEFEGENVGRTSSFLEVLKETHRALNENRPEFYAVPESRALIAQELLLFENSGSDDLEKLVDSRWSKARFSVRMDWEDGVEKQRFLDRVSPRIREAMGDKANLELTGIARMIGRIASATTESLVQSYSLALALITPLMMILIGSLRAGLVSMIPNLLPILMTMGFVIGAGLKFDILMMLGGCIAIGLAVDDSIHFITSFRREYARTGDPASSVEHTMATTGRALLFTSVVLVAGFSVLGLSSMSNLANLGWMTAGAIGLAFVLDVTVTPALLVLTHPQVSRSTRKSAE